ncbi:MAG: hypothetical protein AAGF90_10130, partial [Pseudomonadota bacterium]
MTERDQAADLRRDLRRSMLDRIPDDDPDLKGSRSYVDRILDAYVDMRWSTRALIDTSPSEARLLFFAILSDVLFLLARSLSMVVSAPAEVQAALPTYVGAGVVLAFLVRTSLFYVVAIIAHIVAKPFGGEGSWYETRCAVFWAALVSAPIEIFAAFVTVLVVFLRPSLPFLDVDWLVTAPYFIGPVAFGFFVCAGVAEAEGFRYTYRVMAV